MINENEKWELMGVLVPPKDLAAIIKRVADGTISMASAKIIFNTIYDQNIEKLGVAVSDFIGKRGLMWSDELCAAWEEAEADYVNEMTNAFNQGGGM
jgi:Asp-tRNA(Asn)/Glu-tRNA(Gln) amidotransferase B subunit